MPGIGGNRAFAFETGASGLPSSAAGIKFPGGGNVSGSLQQLQDPSNNNLPWYLSSGAFRMVGNMQVSGSASAGIGLVRLQLIGSAAGGVLSLNNDVITKTILWDNNLLQNITGAGGAESYGVAVTGTSGGSYGISIENKSIALNPTGMVYTQGGSQSFYATDVSFYVGSGTVDGSARFQIDSTQKGFLAPRMTTAQRNAIASPAQGLGVFDTDEGAPYVYNAGWNKIAYYDIVSYGSEGSDPFTALTYVELTVKGASYNLVVATLT